MTSPEEFCRLASVRVPEAADRGGGVRLHRLVPPVLLAAVVDLFPRGEIFVLPHAGRGIELFANTEYTAAVVALPWVRFDLRTAIKVSGPGTATQASPAIVLRRMSLERLSPLGMEPAHFDQELVQPMLKAARSFSRDVDVRLSRKILKIGSARVLEFRTGPMRLFAADLAVKYPQLGWS